MKKTEKPKNLSDIQIDEFLRQLETPEGEERIIDAAWKEAKKAAAQKSPQAKPTTR